MQNFRMSIRFNKNKPEDFGLKMLNGKYYSISDGTEWSFRYLFDYGWGKEYGFYKIPLKKFEDLFKIILFSKDEEDCYGAASIILDDFPEELLLYIENINNEDKIKTNRKKICKFLSLDKPINRTYKNGMTFKEIENEYEKWKKISKKFIAY